MHARLILWLLLPFSLISFATSAKSDDQLNRDKHVAVGATVSKMKFVDIRGLDRDLKDLGEHKAYVFVFTNTTCPLVRRYLPKLKEMNEEFKADDCLFVAVNVGVQETIRDMAAQAVDFELPFFFVKDRDHSCVKALGVRKTPEVVVLDQHRTIQYRGRIDDQMRIGGAKPNASREDLKEAIKQVLAGNAVEINQTEVDGCIIESASEPKATPKAQLAQSDSATTTWSSHIAEIVFQKCANCHRAGTAAPFALTSRDEMAANASMIADVIAKETMPPWYAAKAHGQFQNESGLTADQKQKLLSWIEANCPVGELDKAPELPKAPETDWRIGKPDLIVTMSEEHTIPATGFVPYKYVVLPQIFFSETWVEAFEIKPLNPSIVHHCNMAYMTKDGAGNETFITGYVPGGQPMDLGKFDNGVAYRIPAGAALGLQIHYTTTGTEQKGKIQVGLRFPKREVRKRLHHFVLDPRGWEIPPNDPAFRIESSHTLKHNANLLGLFTHMHVRGRDMTFYAEQSGKERETLLQIPNYNFEWQLGYELAPGAKNFSKGTKIRAVAHFDNSPFNPYNPDPKVAVRYGPQTVDEMFNGFVFYVDNDEDLNIKVNPKNGVELR
ncbi:MAG: redoxin family protein [Pirellulales bacterium]